jgi:elongation factor P
MAATSELSRGMIIRFNNEPHILVEKEFYSPGKGGAFNRCRLKSIKTGKFFYHVFKSGEKVEELDIETKNTQYLYIDGETAYFMDPTTFEQFGVSLEIIPNGTDFLHTDAKYIMSFFEGEVIYVQLPQKITLTVTETSDAVKGNTATNASKEAIVETGYKVQVPLFIKVGDRIVINTEGGTYFSKE